MALSHPEMVALEAVRQLEQIRIEAIRMNDADAMQQILDDKFLYINSDENCTIRKLT